MNIADRILYLRKTKGISQEELADKMGVSRQAVSKWESGQSSPDLEKVIIMSDFFGVTTDYILKGIESVKDKSAEEEAQENKEFASKIFYNASTALIAIGLLCAFANWYEEQTMSVVWGSMIIQVVGIVFYFIGRSLSVEKAPFFVDWLNIAGISFMPASMIIGVVSMVIFGQGWIAPYQIDIIPTLIFAVVYLGILVVSFQFLKKREQSK